MPATKKNFLRRQTPFFVKKHMTRKHSGRKHSGRKYGGRKYGGRKHKARKHGTRKHKARKHRTRKQWGAFLGFGGKSMSDKIKALDLTPTYDKLRTKYSSCKSDEELTNIVVDHIAKNLTDPNRQRDGMALKDKAIADCNGDNFKEWCKGDGKEKGCKTDYPEKGYIKWLIYKNREDERRAARGERAAQQDSNRQSSDMQDEADRSGWSGNIDDYIKKGKGPLARAQQALIEPTVYNNDSRTQVEKDAGLPKLYTNPAASAADAA
jgi:hypothetical protein